MVELALRSPLSPDYPDDGGAPVFFLPETPSTMDDAGRLVRDDPPSGTVIVTDHQTAGRGRRAGRVWHSPPGESLMFTLMLRRPAEPVTRSLVMAASVARTLEERVGLSPRIKWPNDVLVNDRKLCGILADHDGEWLYVGVGLNVRQRGFPDEIAASATSIAMETASVATETGSAPTGALDSCREMLLRSVLGYYRDHADSWLTVLSERLWMLDRRVEIVSPNGERFHAICRGIAPDGRLLAERIGADEGVHRIAAGEVSLYAKADP